MNKRGPRTEPWGLLRLRQHIGFCQVGISPNPLNEKLIERRSCKRHKWGTARVKSFLNIKKHDSNLSDSHSCHQQPCTSHQEPDWAERENIASVIVGLLHWGFSAMPIDLYYISAQIYISMLIYYVLYQCPDLYIHAHIYISMLRFIYPCS